MVRASCADRCGFYAPVGFDRPLLRPLKASPERSRTLGAKSKPNPYDPTDAELANDPALNNDDFEFIEVTNAHPTSDINLANMQFADGVDFTFPTVTLSPEAAIRRSRRCTR